MTIICAHLKLTYILVFVGLRHCQIVEMKGSGTKTFEALFHLRIYTSFISDQK